VTLTRIFHVGYTIEEAFKELIEQREATQLGKKGKQLIINDICYCFALLFILFICLSLMEKLKNRRILF
jgi:hypothetical protein